MEQVAYLHVEGRRSRLSTARPNEQIEQLIRLSASWPDQQIYLQGAFSPGTPFFSEDFAAQVRRLGENDAQDKKDCTARRFC